MLECGIALWLSSLLASWPAAVALPQQKQMQGPVHGLQSCPNACHTPLAAKGYPSLEMQEALILVDFPAALIFQLRHVKVETCLVGT